jgi:hypothetical protein
MQTKIIRGFVPLIFLLFSVNLNSQIFIENFFLEKAKAFLYSNKYDSSLSYLEQVKNNKLQPIKNYYLLVIYCNLNYESKIVDFFRENSKNEIDFKYYSDIVNLHTPNKAIIKKLKSEDYGKTKYNLDETIIQLNYIDQLVRSNKELFINQDSENNIDKFTFLTFKNIFLKNINLIDTSKVLNLDILLIHWAQNKGISKDSILMLFDTLYKYEFILPSSYIRAKEILFFKHNNLSYFGLIGLNPLLGVPINQKIELFEPEKINERRRKVGLLDL